MRLQTDPKVVAKLAEEREDANWRFRTFLKGVDLEIQELDAFVHKHYEEVTSRIDCCACGKGRLHLGPMVARTGADVVMDA